MTMSGPLFIDDRITIPEADLTWTATRSSGPGGQNVNKVSSRVELRFDLAGTAALPDPVKARLRVLARGMLDAEGRILIKSERTRDQRRNLEDAREKLRAIVAQALVVPKRRRPTKPSRAAKQRRLTEKRQLASKKAERRRTAD
jgi:ribosome-associated protein